MTFATCPSARRGGTGVRLAKLLETLAAVQGCRAVVVGSAEDAVPFWRRVGFRPLFSGRATLPGQEQRDNDHDHAAAAAPAANEDDDNFGFSDNDHDDLDDTIFQLFISID